VAPYDHDVDDAGLISWRMRTSRLTGPGLADPAAAVRWLGAVQSQEYGPALWSLAQRADGGPGRGPGGLTEAEVDAAFGAGEFLRTHVLRPTWHFVAPQDIRWLLTATAHRVHALNAPYYRSNGLDPATLARTGAVVTDALGGGNHLTRDELRAVLARAGHPADGQGLAYLLMHAELSGLICSGPRRGRQHTYALLAERAPAARELSPDEALAELTRRYFTGHGPATAKDLRWWSSLTLADVARGLELAGSDLTSAEIGGRRYWFAEPATGAAGGAAVEGAVPASPDVRLLQAYDEYVSYSESRYLLDLSGAAGMLTRDRPIYNHLVLLDGQVIGHWKRTVRRREVLLDVLLHRPLDAGERRALGAAADAHGAFLGGLAATVRTAQL
jgi:hypothetical protein